MDGKCPISIEANGFTAFWKSERYVNALSQTSGSLTFYHSLAPYPSFSSLIVGRGTLPSTKPDAVIGATCQSPVEWDTGAARLAHVDRGRYGLRFGWYGFWPI